MKSPTSTKRPYRGTVQAEVAELTRQRILDAALALFVAQPLDTITFNQVAERSGVTVQTILRHFKSKEGLFTATSKYSTQRVMQQREEAPVGDLAGALQNLIEHYESAGRMALRILALEGQSPAADEALRQGRAYHRAWVNHVFAPFIARAGMADQERLIAQLVTLCDVYTWKLLRLDLGLTRAQTELALYELVAALFENKHLFSNEGA